MDEYISRNALLQTHAENKPLNWTDTEAEIQAVNDWAAFNSLVESIPAADVAEVRYGYWKDNTNGTFTCTACGGRASKMNYCGHCGAKMLGVKITHVRYDELERQGWIESDCLYFITNEEEEE